MIPTGLAEIDHILHGGLRGGITDVSGRPATGKSQLVLQIVRNCISRAGPVLLQDTTGKFRPERLHGMLQSAGLDTGLLDMVSVHRATNTLEQQDILNADLSGYSLLVVDDITSLFRFEYPDRRQAAGRERLFAGYMAALSRASLENGMPVLAVNTVRSTESGDVETMARSISMFTHVRIRLSVEENGSEPERFRYRGTVRLPRASSHFYYLITGRGLEDARNGGIPKPGET